MNPTQAGEAVKAEWEVGEGGVGQCPSPLCTERRVRRGNRYVYEERIVCKCGKCKVCGYPLHSAVHMHAHGFAPGDKPFDHVFVPLGAKP